ncbi:MAG: hypothetical protein ACF8PN_13610 [Phycisphaerales bacterium]
MDAPAADVKRDRDGSWLSHAPRCPRCNYDLSGSLESSDRRCPECGRAWTVDELALQQVADTVLGGWSSRLLWALGPGWAVGVLVAMGAVFQNPIVWLMVAVTVIAVVGVVQYNWARDLYRVSFARARSSFGRYSLIAAGIFALNLINLLQYAAVFVLLSWISTIVLG